MTMFLALTALVVLIGFAGYTIWADHPAARLKRAVRQAVKQEDAAHRQLDEAHTEAKAKMDRTARNWDNQ